MKPDTRVRLAFDLAAGGVGDFFTLDDPTKGELDNATYKLSGDILEDVTEDVRSVTVRRGRSRELERFQAGSLNVRLNSQDRKYDPSFLGTPFNSTTVTFDDPERTFDMGSIFAPSMRPRKAITVTADGEPVFNGVVEDWDIQYSLDGDHVANVKATDGFVFLANENIDAHTTSAQATGARIKAILDRSEINWPAGKRNIDDGTATLQADAIEDGQNALEYLKKVDEAEQGALFISADGLMTFRDKSTVQTLANVKFADDGTGIPFSSIDAAYGSEELRNRVTVSRLNGGTATAEDTDSITAYGAIDYEIKDTLLSTDEQAQALADLIVTRYAEPLLRIDSVEVVTNALTNEKTVDVLALELGDLVEIVYTPSGIGDPINQFIRIDSIEHTIDAATHRIKFSFSRGEGVALVLDSAAFGILDTNTLGY